MAQKRWFFDPWKGANYDSSGFCGKKVLLVGESHYSGYDGSQGPPTSSFTAECVRDHIKGEPGTPFWGRLMNVVAPEYAGRKQEFWDAVAFCNFVQVPLKGNQHDRPVGLQFAESTAAFLDVLEYLEPDRVLLCSRKSGDYLPPASEEKFSPLKVADREMTVLSYRLPSRICYLAVSWHPSSPGGYWSGLLTEPFRNFIDNTPATA